jgi:uncharacterized protein
MALISIGAILFLSLSSAFAAIPRRPEPAKFVNDYAGVLNATQRESLEKRLKAYSDSTTTQIVVVTVKDLEGMDPSFYATELGESWGVGSSEYDNGVVILVKPKNSDGKGKVAIAPGYGLEGAIPDAYAQRIISEIMIPHLKKNDYFTAINNACTAVIRLADGEKFIKKKSFADIIWNKGILMFYVLIWFFSQFIFWTLTGKLSETSRRDSGDYEGGSSYDSSSGSSFDGGSFGGGGADDEW